MRKPAGNRSGASVATALNPYAAPTPMPMSVNMFGLTLRNDRHIRSKNGQPHQTTTGVASVRPTPFTHAAPRR